ncbi:MAG: ribosome biogenesis GTP-binding protein YihA/YsxC, partial [Rhodobacteraceae bacterium]|nr:ribosome biogenesis GTP-binding protein YihA/YsxC [Paracoccaceae bacterium]
MTPQPFPFAPEPTPEEHERGRLMFTGPIDFLKGAVAMDGLPPPDRLEVCFAGRSNVGKSSLINALTGRKNLARASNTPGRTQEINYFTAGDSRYLVDLPGYGFAEAPKAIVEKWQRLLKSYLAGRQTLRR